MAFFALLWKARTIEKYRLDYEKEKLNSIRISNVSIPEKTLFQKWTDYKFDIKKRLAGTYRRWFPEGSSVHNFVLYLSTDQTFPNFLLKSLIGFVGGIVMTYLCFMFFVFQLSISLIHSTIMSSIIGVLLTLGLAFSYRVRCLVFLLIPQFFSRVGRYTLTCYALVLILTGPATNTLKNSEVLSESLACSQEQIKTAVHRMNESIEKPFNSMKSNIKIMVERLKQIIAQLKDTLLKIQRLVLNVAQVPQSAYSWLNSVTNSCNKKLGTPYELCTRALNDGALECHAKFGPQSSRPCNVTHLTEVICWPVKHVKSFCVTVDYVNKNIFDHVKKRLKTFSDRVKSMLLVQVDVHQSHTFSSNASRSASQVAAGIVTEIRNRADPLLTWLAWSSCVTSLFFLLIIFRAKYYQHMFETRSRFDNRYVTRELRDLDFKRMRQGRETILPLNRREKTKYVTTTSFRLVPSEKVHLTRSAVFMVITSFKLMIHIVADYSLYWVLINLRYHGRLETPITTDAPDAGVHVYGSGVVSKILTFLLGSVSLPLDPRTPSLISCLPNPNPPDFQRYCQIGILIILLWFFAMFEPYGLRLRHVIMGLYRPERAKARAVWLYNHVQRTRGGFMKFARRKLHREYKYSTEEKHTFKRWLNTHIPSNKLKPDNEDELKHARARRPVATCQEIPPPIYYCILPPVTHLCRCFMERSRRGCVWVRSMLGINADEPRCLLCGTIEYQCDPDAEVVRCETPNCPGIYCTKCFMDIGQLCTICLSPVDYGDLSDVSLEKGSSDESSDSDGDSDGGPGPTDGLPSGNSNQFEPRPRAENDDNDDSENESKPFKKRTWSLFTKKNSKCNEAFPLLQRAYEVSDIESGFGTRNESFYNKATMLRHIKHSELIHEKLDTTTNTTYIKEETQSPLFCLYCQTNGNMIGRTCLQKAGFGNSIGKFDSKIFKMNNNVKSSINNDDALFMKPVKPDNKKTLNITRAASKMLQRSKDLRTQMKSHSRPTRQLGRKKYKLIKIKACLKNCSSQFRKRRKKTLYDGRKGSRNSITIHWSRLLSKTLITSFYDIKTTGNFIGVTKIISNDSLPSKLRKTRNRVKCKQNETSVIFDTERKRPEVPVITRNGGVQSSEFDYLGSRYQIPNKLYSNLMLCCGDNRNVKLEKRKVQPGEADSDNIENKRFEEDPVNLDENTIKSNCLEKICEVCSDYIRNAKINFSPSAKVVNYFKNDDVPFKFHTTNYKRRKKSYEELGDTKAKILKVKKDNEATRKYRISTFLSDQDWIKRRINSGIRNKSRDILENENEIKELQIDQKFQVEVRKVEEMNFKDNAKSKHNQIKAQYADADKGDKLKRPVRKPHTSDPLELKEVSPNSKSVSPKSKTRHQKKKKDKRRKRSKSPAYTKSFPVNKIVSILSSTFETWKDDNCCKVQPDLSRSLDYYRSLGHADFEKDDFIVEDTYKINAETNCSPDEINARKDWSYDSESRRHEILQYDDQLDLSAPHPERCSPCAIEPKVYTRADFRGPDVKAGCKIPEIRNCDEMEGIFCTVLKKSLHFCRKKFCSCVFKMICSGEDYSRKEKKSFDKEVNAHPLCQSCACQYRSDVQRIKDGATQICDTKNASQCISRECCQDVEVQAVHQICTCATQHVTHDARDASTCLRTPRKKDACTIHYTCFGFKSYKDDSTSYHNCLPSNIVTYSPDLTDTRTKWNSSEDLAHCPKHTPSRTADDILCRYSRRSPMIKKPKTFEDEIQHTCTCGRQKIRFSSTENISSIRSDEGTKTDTTVCSLATINYRDEAPQRKKTKRIKINVVTKSNQSTITDHKKVCDVSTVTSDWWSPIVERKRKDISLEKKDGGYVMPIRKAYMKKMAEKKTKGVVTEGRIVKFKSQTQIIPTSIRDILSPSRYLLESQKYYNELFSTKLYSPRCVPTTNDEEPNRSYSSSSDINVHRSKRQVELQSPRKMRYSKKVNIDHLWTAETWEHLRPTIYRNKNRCSSKFNVVKKSRKSGRINKNSTIALKKADQNLTSRSFTSNDHTSLDCQCNSTTASY